MNIKELNNLNERVDIHKERLRLLENQKAKWGPLNVPAHIPIEIKEEEKEIQRLTNEIERLKPELQIKEPELQIKELEEKLKEARQNLVTLEERLSRKDVSRGAGVSIKTGDISNADVLIVGRDIGKESVSTMPVSQDRIDIEIGEVKGGRLKIAGRDYLQRIEIGNERMEVEAIETELSGLKKGITYRDSWSFLKPNLSDEELVGEVNNIIDSRTIRMFYMPIVNFYQSKKEIIGYELLARGPKGSPLEKRPDKLFEIAGRINRLSELDLLCIKNALEASEKIPAGVHPFINIMPLTLLEEKFWNILNSCPRNNIVFELKEDLIPPEIFQEIKTMVWKLKGKGYEIAADDQGVGGANDQRLIEFKPHYIKVDQYFMRGVWEGQKELAKNCLSSYCSLSKDWNGKVLVEGITEHHSQRDLEHLMAIGISLGQGYLFGEPEEGIKL